MTISADLKVRLLRRIEAGDKPTRDELRDALFAPDGDASAEAEERAG